MPEPVTFPDLKAGDSLSHPSYGEPLSVTELTGQPTESDPTPAVAPRVFLSGKRGMVSFYGGEFDSMGWTRNAQAPVEDQMPAKRYKRLPAWKGKDRDRAVSTAAPTRGVV